MKKKIIQQLVNARNLLESVEVHGKQDCRAMTASMDLIEESATLIKQYLEETDSTEQNTKE